MADSGPESAQGTEREVAVVNRAGGRAVRSSFPRPPTYPPSLVPSRARRCAGAYSHSGLRRTSCPLSFCCLHTSDTLRALPRSPTTAASPLTRLRPLSLTPHFRSCPLVVQTARTDAALRRLASIYLTLSVYLLPAASDGDRRHAELARPGHSSPLNLWRRPAAARESPAPVWHPRRAVFRVQAVAADPKGTSSSPLPFHRLEPPPPWSAIPSGSSAAARPGRGK